MFGKISAISYIRQTAKFQADDEKITFSTANEIEQYEKDVRIKLIGRTDDNYRDYVEKIAIKEWEHLHENIANSLAWNELPTFIKTDFISVIKAMLEEETKGM